MLLMSMIDIMSNTMAGIAVLFFLQVALQQQEPPPTPVRGRLVFKINLSTPYTGIKAPSIFLARSYDGKNEIYFDNNINSHRSDFKFTDDPVAQISLKRQLFKAINRNDEWEVHLLDPMEGTYTLGIIYTDHDRFQFRKTPINLTVNSYFEMKKDGKEYKSNQIEKQLSSPTSFHKYVVKIEPSIDNV